MPDLVASPWRVAVVGGGPAGLMAADVMSAAGVHVDVFDAMPSVGRKFLLAGVGGLNLTHAEPFRDFVDRFGPRRHRLEPLLEAFGAADARAFAAGLGIATFIGSSRRVFPVDLKAAPLLRAWLLRLRRAGVGFHTRHRWLGWVEGGAGRSHLRFAAPGGETVRGFDAVVLALGGASWPRLGSDGAWVPLLAAADIEVAPLKPSNCGFDVAGPGFAGRPAVGWSDHFRSRFAGQPLKNVVLSVGERFRRHGEFVVTEGGVEGSLVYAASTAIRDVIEAEGQAIVSIDLLPHRSASFVHDEATRPRGSRSRATHLKSRLGIDGVRAGMLHERLPADVVADPPRLAAAIKALPLGLHAPRPIAEAISSAGGVGFDALDSALMVRRHPGLFCAGEMLDWEAPTGGYLLTACLASGAAAGHGVLAHLRRDGAGQGCGPDPARCDGRRPH